LISSCTDAPGLGVKPWCSWCNQKSAILDEVDVSVLPAAEPASLDSTAPTVELIEKDELARSRPPMKVELLITRYSGSDYGIQARRKI
jgi:hypothetical protein